jgi:hypothetical protein
MIVSYDIDGVLADKPPASNLKWGKMNGEQRQERKKFLVDWYINATPLIQPKEEKFYAISARKLEPNVFDATEKWLNTHYTNRVIDFFLLRESRTVENAARFKASIVCELGIMRHYEDNKKVLKEMRKHIPNNVELFFWEVGMEDPIPYI